jgi:hypothetical protein
VSNRDRFLGCPHMDREFSILEFHWERNALYGPLAVIGTGCKALDRVAKRKPKDKIWLEISLNRRQAYETSTLCHYTTYWLLMVGLRDGQRQGERMGERQCIGPIMSLWL